MAIYWIIAYNIKSGKEADFEKYLRSGKFKELRKAFVNECGIRILVTYFKVDPSSRELGEYDALDVWELPSYAAIDKYEKSKARMKFVREYVVPYVGDHFKWITARKASYLN